MEKINVAELLKDCPSGMELDCTMYDNLHFDKVDDYDKKIHCYIQYKDHRTHIMFGKDGTYNSEKASKCVIFPKGKTSWEGFVPPCQFKDGDIVVSSLGNIHILKNSTTSYIYVDFTHNANGSLFKSLTTCVRVVRLATEEEKEKLFKVIKDNGYRWNEETKTLEKLIEPKFKVGNWYQCTKDMSFGTCVKCITFDKNTVYHCAQEGCLQDEYGRHIAIDKDLYDNFKLWTIQDAKEGDVLANDHHILILKELVYDWSSNGTPYSVKAYCGIKPNGNFEIGKDNWCFCGTLHIHPATEEEKAKLFQTIKDTGYRWNEETKILEEVPKFKVGDKIFNVLRKSMGALGTFQGTISEITDDKYIFTDGSYMFIDSQDNYELVPDKFDITTLVPFESRVLARDNEREKWYPGIWGYYDNDADSTYPYKLIGCIARYCIPYEGNEHLRGKVGDCDKYFKTWE